MTSLSKQLPENFFAGASPIALIAGGAGFVGSHLCQYFLEKGVKVICLDNWLTGVRENISHLQDRENFLFLERDINKPLTKDIERVDYIVHLAAVEAYLNGEDVSIETLEANSVGTRNLLEFSKKKNARFCLVSTVGVFSAKISPKDVASYFGDGRAQEGEFSHHEAKRFAEVLTAEYGQKQNVDVRIVRLADVYGPRMMLSRGSPLANLLRQAVFGQTLKVPGDEHKSIYPVYILDVVEALGKSLFVSGTRNKIIGLAGPKATLFSLAQTLQKILEGNQVSIEFISKIEDASERFIQTAQTAPAPDEGVLYANQNLISWKPKVEQDVGLRETLRWFSAHKQSLTAYTGKRAEERPGAEKKESFWSGVFKVPAHYRRRVQLPKPTKSPKNRFVFLAVFVISFFLFWLFLLPFFQVASGIFELSLVRKEVLAGNTSRGRFWASKSIGAFDGAREGFLRWEKLPGLGAESKFLAQKASVLSRVGLIAQSATVVGEEAVLFFEGVLGEESFSPQPGAQRLSLELDSLNQELAFLEAELQEEFVIRFPYLPSFNLSRTVDFASIRSAVSTLAAILPEAEDLLGVEAKKTYLVLLQNNMELRPTGGFIGSFALVTFQNGRLINHEVQDVYFSDGQLKGHVEPPAALKGHLGEASWFLRDSNWSPHFPTSARRAAWFLEKELGEQVDGVVAVDLEFVRDLIQAYGPLELADFSSTITSDNFYLKTQEAAEGEFFPGSRAKKDFLTALSRTLLAKIIDSPKSNLPALAKSAYHALEQRHAAVFVENEKTKAALARRGWDGGLRNVKCQAAQSDPSRIPEDICFADYLLAVDANLGVNKANFFLERSYALEVGVEEDAVNHQLTVSFKNSSQSGVWPGGDYKNYFRIFVPEGATTAAATLVNPEGEQRELEIDEGFEHGMKEFGMLAQVPAGQRRQLTVSWKIPVNNLEELVFLWQKQMGIVEDPVWLRFNFPGGITAAAPSPALTTPTSVDYNTDLARDLLFDIKWERQ